jgi:hypothetical protein
MTSEMLIHVGGYKLNCLLQVLVFLAHVKPPANQPDFLIFSTNRELSAYDFTELFGKAYPKVQTGEFTTSVIFTTRIYFVNMNACCKCDCLAARKEAVHRAVYVRDVNS